MLPTMIIPVIDRSGSMYACMPHIIRGFNDSPVGFDIMCNTFISFNHQATIHPHGRPSLDYASGGTNIAGAFVKLEEVMAHTPAKRYVVVFISDGEDSHDLPGTFATRISALKGPPRGSECVFLTVMFGNKYPTDVMQHNLRPLYHSIKVSGFPWMFGVDVESGNRDAIACSSDHAFSMLFSVVENLDLYVTKPAMITHMSSTADVMRMASFEYNEVVLELVAIMDLDLCVLKLKDLRNRLVALCGIGGKGADLGVGLLVNVIDRTMAKCGVERVGVGSFTQEERGKLLSEGNKLTGKHYLKGLRRFKSDFEKDLTDFVSKALTFVPPPNLELQDFILFGSEREAMETLATTVKEDPEGFTQSAPDLSTLMDTTAFFVHCVHHPSKQYAQLLAEPYFYRIEAVGSINTVTTTLSLGKARLDQDRREPMNGCMLISTCPQWLASRLSEQMQTKLMTGDEKLHFHNAHLVSAAAFVSCLLQKGQCTDQMVFVLRMLGKVYSLEGVSPNKPFHLYTFKWMGPEFPEAASPSQMPDIGKAILAMSYALFNPNLFGWNPSTVDLRNRRDALLVYLFSKVKHPRTILQVEMDPTDQKRLFDGLVSGICEDSFTEMDAVAAFKARLEALDCTDLMRKYWRMPSDGFESIKGPLGYSAYDLWGWTPNKIQTIFATMAKSRGLTLDDCVPWGCLERALCRGLCDWAPVERLEDPTELVCKTSVGKFRESMLQAGEEWIIAKFAAYQTRVHATGVSMMIPQPWIERLLVEEGINLVDVGLSDGVPRWACCCLSCPFFMKRMGKAAYGERAQPILNREMYLHLRQVKDVLGLHKTTFRHSDKSPEEVAGLIISGQCVDSTVRCVDGARKLVTDWPAFMRTQIEIAMGDAGAAGKNMAKWVAEEVRIVRAVGSYETLKNRVIYGNLEKNKGSAE